MDYAFGGGGGKVSSPVLYNTENINSKIAAETNITNIEYKDFEATCSMSMISQIPKIANTVKNSVIIANKIEMPFLNIIIRFLFNQI
jgi:hypothetical protein